MIPQELQDKFYAALESMKDGKNNYIIDSLAAGAKATFESFDGKKPTPCIPQVCNHPSPMVAEAITKLGNAIMAMRTKENAALVEAIKSGCDSCFTFNYDGNGWSPDEENPQPTPQPEGKYRLIGANDVTDNMNSEPAEGVYAHGELEDRLGFDILDLVGTTTEQFIQDLVEGLATDPNYGNGIPVTVAGINEPCSMYLWCRKFGNYTLPQGLVVLNSDTESLEYARNMWQEKPKRV